MQAAPPARADRALLKDFYLRRALARASLGRLADAIADCKNAVANSADYLNEERQFEATQERLMRLNGDYKGAIALLERMAQKLDLEKHWGRAFGTNYVMVINLLHLGEQRECAREGSL